MRRSYSIAVAGLLWLAMAPMADAQRIRVGGFGGVSIRVPFVSVDVLPFGGGTRVRAPFTSVNTGLYGIGYGSPYRGYRYYDYGYYPSYRPAPYLGYDVVPVYPGPIYSVPVVPPVDPLPTYSYRDDGYRTPPDYQVARPSYPSERSGPVTQSPGALREQLRSAAGRLKRSLAARRDDADIWLDYLRPDQILEVLDRGEPAQSLRELSMNYEGVAGNSQLTSIWSADGFWQTQRALRSFVNQPSPQGVEHQPRRVESEPASENEILPAPKPDPGSKPKPSAVPPPPVPVRPASGGDATNSSASVKTTPL